MTTLPNGRQLIKKKYEKSIVIFGKWKASNMPSNQQLFRLVKFIYSAIENEQRK